MSNFKREERYVVIKLSDLNSNEKKLLQTFTEQYLIKTRDCVVVESDWPEYEPTWKAIQDRCECVPSKQETAIDAWRDWYASAPHEELTNPTVAQMAFKQGVAYALNLGSYKP